MQYVENVPGIRSSRLGFGCAPVMGKVGRKDALTAMARALERGVNHFDVARSYGFGEAEGVLGAFARGRRDKLVIASKFGIRATPMSAAKKLLTPLVRLVYDKLGFVRGLVRRQSAEMLPQGFYDLQSARQSVETSLRELGTDYLDYLFVHEPTPWTQLTDETLAYLDSLVEQGRVRAWGISTRADWACANYSQAPRAARVLQYECNLFVAAPDCHLPCARLHTSPFGGVRTIERLQAVAGRPELAALLAECGGADLMAMLLAGALHRAGEATMTLTMLKPRHIEANLAALALLEANPAGVERFAASFPALWQRLAGGVS